MNLCDSRFPHPYAALRKKGLVTRLCINTLNLLHDSEPDHAPGGGGPAWGELRHTVLLPEFANLFVVCAFPAERAVALP